MRTVSAVSKHLVKRTVDALFNRHDPAGGDIALFCTRRCGSTWLVELLTTQPGAKMMGAPIYRAYDIPSYREMLPDIEYGDYTDDPIRKTVSLSREQERRYKAFVARLLRGEVVVNGPWRAWEPSYPRRSDHLVLQLTNQKSQILLYEREFPVRILYQLRHPVPNALSIINRGWRVKARAFLDDAEYRERYLSPALVDHAERILDNGSELEKHVLDWCLENRVPLIHLEDHPHWTILTYEQMVVDPPGMIERLTKGLDLPEPQRISAKLEEPSRSTLSESRKLIESDASRRKLIERWRGEVSQTEVDNVAACLEAFGVTAYQADEILPSGEFLEAD